MSVFKHLSKGQAMGLITMALITGLSSSPAYASLPDPSDIPENTLNFSLIPDALLPQTFEDPQDDASTMEFFEFDETDNAIIAAENMDIECAGIFQTIDGKKEISDEVAQDFEACANMINSETIELSMQVLEHFREGSAFQIVQPSASEALFNLVDQNCTALQTPKEYSIEGDTTVSTIADYFTRDIAACLDSLYMATSRPTFTNEANQNVQLSAEDYSKVPDLDQAWAATIYNYSAYIRWHVGGQQDTPEYLQQLEQSQPQELPQPQELLQKMPSPR